MNVYLTYVKSSWKEVLAYGWNVFMWMFSDICQVASIAFIWYTIYGQGTQTSINGYSYESVIMYTIMATVTVNLYALGTEFLIAEEVSSGQIVNNFVRPISYVKRLIAEGVGRVLYNLVFLLVPVSAAIVAYSYVTHFDAGITLESATLYAVSLVFSIALNFMISFMIGLAAFYVNYIWGFLMLRGAVMMLVTGQLFPLNFLPEGIVALLKMTPFYYMNFGPVSILLNRFTQQEAWQLILIQLVWCVLLAGCSYLVWQSAKRRITVNGG